MSDILHLLASDPNVDSDFRAIISDMCCHGVDGYCRACEADEMAVERMIDERRYA